MFLCVHLMYLYRKCVVMWHSCLGPPAVLRVSQLFESASVGMTAIRTSHDAIGNIESTVLQHLAHVIVVEKNGHWTWTHVGISTPKLMVPTGG